MGGLTAARTGQSFSPTAVNAWGSHLRNIHSTEVQTPTTQFDMDDSFLMGGPFTHSVHPTECQVSEVDGIPAEIYKSCVDTLAA
ncbi:unnamed protein product [Dibothriocephalus latus]|uniref:Uncharacterized protein n=1 Tax=Dibothriocephalus latus TaxID=60516 RepID=A0A3P7M964_DIBLA|nr:unnamed protein product [Dibothriocephalus latus]